MVIEPPLWTPTEGPAPDDTPEPDPGEEAERVLLILSEIQPPPGFRTYRPGDLLPADTPGAENWVASGAAKWVPADYTPPRYAIATRASAPAGLFGKAYGGETEQALVGHIPATPERARKWSYPHLSGLF